MDRRQTVSVADLLDAFMEARQYVQPQTIKDVTLQGITYTSGLDGSLNVEATITDNQVVPQSTQRRPVDFAMVYEQGRWKLGPSIDPL
ncbi:hypothetical protein EEB14_22955 [Rhodococcus sp. WS4]|nr:hypothetical protein EEB14_22955 [Rhodococcus sp. WS4]